MRHLVKATWDDVPHLTEDQKATLFEAMPPHERDARARGIPILGAGAIYPVKPELYECEPFEIPPHWPRAYGMDVGWKRTAAEWGAWDRESDTVYVYSEHYMGKAEPSVHADAVKARGDWIPGAMDPASHGSSQLDGKRLHDEYRALGLLLFDADNAVEAGIHAVYRRLSAGRLKIFTTCRALLSEIRLYHRDENGKVVKEDDHAVDALRYLIMTGLMHAQVEPYFDDDYDRESAHATRSPVTGY